MAESVLRLNNVVAGYGGEVPVLRGLDLVLETGITAVIGANGAGKSTLLKVIFGLVRTSAGTIAFQDEDITKLTALERLKRGIVIVPQGRCHFPLMTVQENLEMGAYTRADKRIQLDIERICKTFPILKDKRKQLAGNLSGGEAQLLEMGMALMIEPRLMLVDEPSLGLSPAMQKLVFNAIVGLRDLGVDILLVEQNAVQALTIASMGIVVERGKVARIGSGVKMLEDPDVRRSYLGLPA